MADVAAASLVGRPIVGLVASPLQRTQESAAPWSKRFGLEVQLDERLIEPVNRFEGLNLRKELRNPRYWPYLVNPAGRAGASRSGRSPLGCWRRSPRRT